MGMTMKFLCAFAALPLLAAVGEEAPVWTHPGIPRAAYVHPQFSSAVRWIWREEKMLNSGDVSYFRAYFTVPEGATLQFFNIDFEQRAEFYVNGVRVDKEKVGAAFRPGPNLFAAKVTDVSQTRAGLIFRGVWKTTEGKTVEFISNMHVKCACSEEPGWERPDFDDVPWRKSAEIGDALAMPWSHRYDMTKPFMTEKEIAAYEARREAMRKAPLPASLLSEPASPDVKIVYRGNQPKISVNGELIEPDFALSSGNPGEQAFTDSGFMKMNSLGFRTIRLTMRPVDWWRDDGNYDFSSIDIYVRRILAYAPNAFIEVSIQMRPLWEWAQTNPDEAIAYGTCKATSTYGDDFGPVVRPSAASLKFRHEVTRIFEKFGDYLSGQPWGRRVIAVRTLFGLYGEWHTPGFARCPDTGVAMTAAFRHYLTRKYGTDAALAKAWREPDVTLATAAVPTEAERTAGVGTYLLDPVTHRKALDFFDCNAEVNASLLLYMGKELKRLVPGRLVGAYYGYIFCDHPPEGANSLLDRVLSSPHIDYLSCPAGYEAENRHAGGPYITRTVPSAYRRRGKLPILEDDERFSWMLKHGVRVDFCLRTEAEDVACMKRAYLNKLFDGTGLQTLDCECSCGSRPYSFDNPAVLQALHDAIAAYRKAGTPPAESGNRIAVVVDEREPLKMDGKCYTKCPPLKRFASAALRLYRCGVPFDLLTKVDYEAERGRYDAALFLEERNLRDTPAQYAELLTGLGGRAWTDPGEYLRVHGDLVMLHTGRAGSHTVRLPDGVRGATELLTGRSFAGSELVFETEGPDTLLFKMETH